jgi:hypothetical protein
MNCKPGDIAYVINATMPQNIGRMVQVISPLGVEPHWGGYIWRIGSCKGQFCWLVRSCGAPLTNYQREALFEAPFADWCLRPIRPQDDDAQDESFRWAPAPEKVLA